MVSDLSWQATIRWKRSTIRYPRPSLASVLLPSRPAE